MPDSELYKLFDRAPIGMYRSTEDGRILYANAALVRLLGYERLEDVLALNLPRDVYRDPEDRARIIERYRVLGHAEGLAVAWHTRDGRPLTVRVFGEVTHAPDGLVFDASVLDITEQDATVAELRRQREQLDMTLTTLGLVVRQMPALYWVMDRDLRILSTGGAVEEVLGYAPEKFVDRTLQFVHDFEPGSTDPVAMHARALRGETVTYTTEYRSKHLVTTVCPHVVDGPAGKQIVGVIGTCIDVTAYHMLERRMVDAQRAESLGVLAGGLAHDFNNLLVAILGNADLALREIAPGAPGRAALENIRQAGLRAAELTDQLLAYAGRGGVSTTRVVAAPVVDELLRISAATIPSTVAVRVDIPPELAVRGDAAQLRQVLLNLLANARDAIGERRGTITVTGRLVHLDGSPDPDDVEAADAGSYVALAVADDGPGMDRVVRRRIFEPFFTTKSTGHGLGLAAVLGIVRSHRGGLRLASKPGEGARFTVMWPSTSTPMQQPAVAPPPARTILVIDDEELVRDVIARMVEDLGYAAVTASDGVAGLALVAERPIDAVLVDLTMPRMSGADVVAAMRVRHPGIPVVLCTGYDRERRGPVDAHAYLAKPFRIHVLEKTLASLFT